MCVCVCVLVVCACVQTFYCFNHTTSHTHTKMSRNKSTTNLLINFDGIFLARKEKEL